MDSLLSTFLQQDPNDESLWKDVDDPTAECDGKLMHPDTRFCFLSGENKQYYCYPKEVAILQELVIAALFLYQMFVVWRGSLGYRFCEEKRLSIMAFGLLYIGMYIFFVSAQGIWKTYSVMMLSWMHYQICSMTFIYYFKRILCILPTIEKKMKRNLLVFHCLNTVVLLTLMGFVMAEATSIYDRMMDDREAEMKKRQWSSEKTDAAIMQYVEEQAECRNEVYLSFQVYILFTFLVYFGMTLGLKSRVQQLEQNSKIDRKINYQYCHLCDVLKFIVVFQLVCEVVQNFQDIFVKWFSGECFIQTCNELANNIIFYITCPTQHFCQIASILYIFWRKKPAGKENMKYNRKAIVAAHSGSGNLNQSNSISLSNGSSTVISASNSFSRKRDPLPTSQFMQQRRVKKQGGILLSQGGSLSESTYKMLSDQESDDGQPKVDIEEQIMNHDDFFGEQIPDNLLSDAYSAATMTRHTKYQMQRESTGSSLVSPDPHASRQTKGMVSDERTTSVKWFQKFGLRRSKDPTLTEEPSNTQSKRVSGHVSSQATFHQGEVNPAPEEFFNQTIAFDDRGYKKSSKVVNPQYRKSEMVVSSTNINKSQLGEPEEETGGGN